MAREISERRLRDEADDIWREVESGESFVVTRAGVPVGELVPLRRHRFVSAETVAAIFRGAPPIDSRSFRRDLDAAAARLVFETGTPPARSCHT
jgi:antitoxin (DNA-binding transcriptional repressor) of toxin-antitoxin stability system